MNSFTNKLTYNVPTQIPRELLESMKQFCDKKDHENAVVGPGGDWDPSLDESVRKSDVYWINWDEWIPGIIHNMMIAANNAHFNYDLHHFDSTIQSTVYRGQGSFYEWHVDNTSPYERNGQLMERKLSCSLILSDPDEYEGGELQFSYYSKCFESVKPPAGTAIIFPSWLPHRVRPLKSGVRRSLVAWMNGPLFK